ncbi:MAG: phosphoribosylglycinamide formyltransferase, partial [Planctomycetaceae bacterium]
TTLLNFLDQIRAGKLAAEIPLVISSQRDCRGVERAREAGLVVEVVRRTDCNSVTEFSQQVFQKLRQADVDLVTLAGFLCLIEVPEDFRHRVLNIHPALIPAFCGPGFYGHHVHEAAVQRGVKISGCTVHFADNQYDHGPIVLQRSVDVSDQVTPEQLADQVFALECAAYPEAVRLFASGRLVVRDGRVEILENGPV